MSSVPVMVWNPASRLDPLYNAEDALELPVNLLGATPAISYSKGQLLGPVAATPGLFAPYNPGAADGTQNATHILRYAAQSLAATAVAGAITWVGEFPGITASAVPAFESGDFDLSLIIGLDAAAVTNLKAAVKGIIGVDEVDSITVSATGGTWGVTIPTVTKNNVIYPAVVVPNTGLAWNTSNTTMQTVINAAILAAGVPGSVTITGGVGGTNPLVLTFHGAYGGTSFVLADDATQLTGGAGTAAITRSTHGAAATGSVHIG